MYRILFSIALLHSSISEVAGQDQTIIKLEGEVNNLTVGKSDTVTMKLRNSNNGPMITGEFGCQDLFGRFALKGLSVTHQEEDTKSFVFEGSLHLGNDGSNWKPDTTLPFNMTLMLGGDSVTGVYMIGKNGNQYANLIPQMGSLKMRRERSPLKKY